MKHLVLALALVLGLASPSAFAGELDNEGSVTNKAFSGTMIVRVDTRTNEMTYSKSVTGVQSIAQAQVMLDNVSFTALPAQNVRGELDRDGGASSWYFYTGYSSYSYMYWYGSWYTPCYSYSYSYYQYYFYSNCWHY
jgi:hypothetical protein